MNWLKLRKALFCAVRPALWRQLAYGVAPTIEHGEALRRYSFRTIIDIGANRGQFSALSRALFPTAEIHAFEPLEAPARIHRHLMSHDKHFHLYQTAIGEIARNAEIFVTTRDDSSSLLAPIAERSDIFGQSVKRMERISVRRLSDCMDITGQHRPTLLKIDVQGGELNVLNGSSDILPHVDVVYVECSYIALYEEQPLYTEVASWLASRDFKLAGVFNQHSDIEIGPVQADFLFVRTRSDTLEKDAA